MEYYTAQRKKDLLPFTTAWMDLESITLSERSQAVKDKYHVISPISGTQSQYNKQVSKIEPEAWKHGIDWQRPEAWEEEDHGGKRGKGLVKEHVLITHGHGQRCGD